jgi:hypothetical protein
LSLAEIAEGAEFVFIVVRFSVFCGQLFQLFQSFFYLLKTLFNIIHAVGKRQPDAFGIAESPAGYSGNVR